MTPPRALILREADRLLDRALVARPLYVVGFLAADVLASVALFLAARRLSRGA